ncbi:MAG: hypothetical protein WCP24_00870 [bacterium]
MFNIAQYLEKFKTLGLGDQSLKEAFVSVIKEVVGMEIEEKSIMVKDGEIIIKVSPSIKNAIYIKKAQILKRVEEKVGQKTIDIR